MSLLAFKELLFQNLGRTTQAQKGVRRREDHKKRKWREAADSVNSTCPNEELRGSTGEKRQHHHRCLLFWVSFLRWAASFPELQSPLGHGRKVVHFNLWPRGTGWGEALVSCCRFMSIHCARFTVRRVLPRPHGPSSLAWWGCFAS